MTTNIGQFVGTIFDDPVVGAVVLDHLRTAASCLPGNFVDRAWGVSEIGGTQFFACSDPIVLILAHDVNRAPVQLIVTGIIEASSSVNRVASLLEVEASSAGQELGAIRANVHRGALEATTGPFCAHPRLDAQDRALLQAH